MRVAPLLFGLSLIAMSGCVNSRSLARTSSHSSPIIRAESDHLIDLEVAAHEGQVDDKNKTNDRSERKHGCSHCRRCNNNPCTCSSSSENNFAGQVFVMTISAPFTVPACLLHDDYEHYTEFPDFPYADGVPGALLIDREFKGKTQSLSGNLQMFAVPGFDDLDRYGGRLVLESAARIGIDTETNYWRSTHSNGGVNHAWTGDVNLVFRFAESEHVQWRAGVGVNWLADQISPEMGVNFTYGVDWFPRRPWTVSSVIDCGTLGGSTLFHNRSTAGVMVGPMELFAGYDYFQLGTANFHGPVAGLGYRF